VEVVVGPEGGLIQLLAVGADGAVVHLDHQLRPVG
jgi:hypothetical protein